MLIIDKRNEQQRLIVTASEKTITSEPSYVIILSSSYSNKSFQITLPASTSQHPERYDEFIIDTTEFSDIEKGIYKFSIIEETDGNVQSGTIVVIDAETESSQFVAPTTGDDDYVIYEG